MRFLKRKLWLVAGLYYISYFGSSLSYDDLLSFRLCFCMRNQEKQYTLALFQFIKLLWGFSWILEDTKSQRDHSAASVARRRYDELMIERKSMAQNVEHICHPQKAVKMGRVWENSWKPPATMELDSWSEIKPNFLKLCQSKIRLHGEVWGFWNSAATWGLFLCSLALSQPFESVTRVPALSWEGLSRPLQCHGDPVLQSSLSLHLALFSACCFSCLCRVSRGLFALQTLVDLCSKSPCKNKGTCVQTLAQTRCVCPPGWTGAYCDVPSVSCQVAASQRGKAASSGLQQLCAQAPPSPLCTALPPAAHFSSRNTLCSSGVCGSQGFLGSPHHKNVRKEELNTSWGLSFSRAVLHGLPFWKMHQLFMLNPRQAKPQVSAQLQAGQGLRPSPSTGKASWNSW